MAQSGDRSEQQQSAVVLGPRFPQPFPAFQPRDGRYLGEGGRWWVELRVDAAGSGMISADLHRPAGGSSLVRLSGRTMPGGRVDPGAGAWLMTWQHEGDGTESTGRLAIDPVTDVPDAVVVRIQLDPLPSAEIATAVTRADDPLGAQSPAGAGPTIVVARMARVGDLLRTLGLEIEIEDGVRPPQPIVVGGEQLDVAKCLRRSGFDVQPVGRSSVVPRPDGGRWHGVHIIDRLNESMHAVAQAPLDAAAWEAHVLLLSTSDRPGLFGVMPDFADDLPRQGAAVFVNEIRSRYAGDAADQRIIQSIVHELGHVLNLSHRFSTGQWDSTSFMNYDWWYRGGRQVRAFQRDFDWRFDPDELAFLRHGFRRDVIPGGAAFGSDEYWSRTPEDRARDRRTDLRLWLTPRPEAVSHGVFQVAPGQPVFLSVSLANLGEQPVVLPRHALDVKAGQLTIAVQRVAGTSGAAAGAAPSRFTPVMRRCYDVGEPDLVRPLLVRLSSGESLHENVNLALGSAGSPFPEPGDYTVTPTLIVPTADPDGGAIVEISGDPLRLTVGAPAADVEEADAHALGSTPLGLSLALGGTSSRGDGRAALTAMRDRRDRDGAGPDPVVAAIDRVLGLDAGRADSPAVPAGSNGAGSGAGSNLDLAAELLEASLQNPAAPFDPHTTEHTRRLAAGYRLRAVQLRQAVAAGRRVFDLAAMPAAAVSTPVPAAAVPLAVSAAAAPPAGEPDAPPAVVVELSAPDGNGTVIGGLVAGVFRDAGPGGVWSVIAPADVLPPAAMADGAQVTATVVVAGSDGLTERIGIPRVDLVGRDDGTAPVLAQLWLPRPLPGTNRHSRLFQQKPGDRITADRSVWQIFAEGGIVPAGLEVKHDEDFADWTAAASLPVAALGEEIPQAVASTHAFRETSFEDPSWGCKIIKIFCDEDEPDPSDPDAPYPFAADPYDPGRGRKRAGPSTKSAPRTTGGPSTKSAQDTTSGPGTTSGPSAKGWPGTNGETGPSDGSDPASGPRSAE